MSYRLLTVCSLVLATTVLSAATPRLNEHGILEVDGKPFFPVMLYRVPIGAFSTMAEAGFNATEVSEYAEDLKEMERYLDAARAKNYKILPIFNFAATRMLPDAYRRMVERFRDRDEILVWYMADEPQQYNITSDGAHEMYRAIKAADPDRPVLLLFAKFDPAYVTAADIIAVDPYPVANNKPLTCVAEVIREAQQAGGGRPVWGCMEAFGALSFGRPFPTPAEERCMTYMALTQGIQGLMFFAYGCPEQKGDLADVAPELWREVLSLAAEVQELAPLFTAPPVVRDYRIAPQTEGVYSRLFRGLGYDWLLVVNGTREAQTLSVSVAKLTAPEVEVYREGRRIPVAAEGFQDAFAPLAVHWYRFPSLAVNEE